MSNDLQCDISSEKGKVRVNIFEIFEPTVTQEAGVISDDLQYYSGTVRVNIIFEIFKHLDTRGWYQ